MFITRCQCPGERLLQGLKLVWMFFKHCHCLAERLRYFESVPVPSEASICLSGTRGGSLQAKVAAGKVSLLQGAGNRIIQKMKF
jgi:hypothetical protein